MRLGGLGFHVKCAPGEVTEERRMAKSMSFHQSEGRLRGTGGKKKRKVHGKHEYKQVF